MYLAEVKLSSTRTLSLSTNSHLTVFNRLRGNPYDLWAIPIHWSTGILPKVQKIAYMVKKRVRWVIFYIHKVSDDLSDPLTSMTPSQLRASVEILATDENINVITIEEGVRLGHLSPQGRGR